jgi:DNA helicase-2/ATP-dependent DNA helicase PcrA
MTAANHPAYHEELDRFRYTLGYVEKSLEKMLAQKQKVDEKVSSTKRHMSYESSQEYIDYIIGSMFQDRLSLMLYNLNAARSRPYFARVDFREGIQKNPEKLYIGKMALIRDEDQELLIVDWRAPIANLYYEGRLGEASYMCPDGKINGELLVKRQFSID